MTLTNQTQRGFINVIDQSNHKHQLNIDNVTAFTDNFARPALLKDLVNIRPWIRLRGFFEKVNPEETLQWRVRDGDSPVSMMAKDGHSDYNYVTGKLGRGKEFLDDIYLNKLEVYSHLGTISSGYNDPYLWGKHAFNLVKGEIFSDPWLDVPEWSISGHFFFGRSNHDFSEPAAGAVGSDWHMFPTLNIFVMIAGVKQWSTRPPELGEQLRYDFMFPTSSGREAPGRNFACDTVYVRPGDVVINPPFEWHKVLNGTGLSIGAAFRVIDTAYLGQLGLRKSLDLRRADYEHGDKAKTEELAHFLTSLRYASTCLSRAQMMLNDVEYAYLRKRDVTTQRRAPAQTTLSTRAGSRERAA